MNPYEPPSPHADAVKSPSPEPAVRPLTARELFKRVVRTLERQPVPLLVLLALLPTLWQLPSTWLHDTLGLNEEAESVRDRVLSLVDLVVSTVWSCVWYAGTFNVALDAVRGQRATWKRYVAGVRELPRMTALSLVIMAPFLPLILMPTPGEDSPDVIALAASFVIGVGSGSSWRLAPRCGRCSCSTGASRWRREPRRAGRRRAVASS